MAEYVPAPHLVASSFLSTEELVLYYKDFKESLRYISSAPELVYERLVANLGITFTTILARQRDDIATASASNVCSFEDMNQLIVGLQSAMDTQASLLEGCITLNELYQSTHNISRAAEVGPVAEGDTHDGAIEDDNSERVIAADPSDVDESDNPTIRSLRECPEQSPNPPYTGLIRKQFTFTKTFNNTPDLALGITAFHITDNARLDISCHAAIQSTSSYEITLSSLRDTSAHPNGCAWLELDPNDPDFQSGCVTLSANGQEGFTHKQCVRFTRPYLIPPQVVVWLRRVTVGSSRSFGVHATAANITSTGFTVHISGLQDGDEFVAASWVSCTAGKAGVTCGTIQPSSVDHVWSSAVTFQTPFHNPPRVIMAINAIEIENPHDVNVSIDVNNIRRDRMTWELRNLYGSGKYCIGASYIALG